MATPRKNWFKVPDSIAFDNLTNDELAGLIRLQGYMNARWARDGRKENERGRAELDSRLMMMITGKRRADVAAKSVERLVNIGEMFVERYGDIIEIYWPNYAIFQEPDSRKSPSPISETPPSQDLKKKREAPASVKTSDRPASRTSRARSACPDRLEPEARQRIIDWAHANRISDGQIAYAWSQVRDWARSNSKLKSDWEATLRNAIREGWALRGYPGASTLGGAVRRAAEDVIAEAKRKQIEDDRRARDESPDEIGNLIDLSLRKAGA